MSETKIQAVLDYGERLKIRSENDILYQKFTTYFDIQIRNVIIILIILWYFKELIQNQQNNMNNSTQKNEQKYVLYYLQPGFGQQLLKNAY